MEGLRPARPGSRTRPLPGTPRIADPAPRAPRAGPASAPAVAAAVVSVVVAAVAAVATVVAAALVAAPAGASEVPRVYALTNARVVTAAGKVFENATVVLRDGVVESVGPAVAVPADALAIDLAGKSVYPGLVDPYVTLSRLAGRKAKPGDDGNEEDDEGPARRDRNVPAGPPVRADRRAFRELSIDPGTREELRALGFTVVAAVPEEGVLRGEAAVVALGDVPLEKALVRDRAAQVACLEPNRGGFRAGYPASKMGAVAAARQAFLDAKWWAEAEKAYGARPAGRARPAEPPGADALADAVAGREPVLFEAPDVLALLRAAQVAREMGLDARFVGAWDAWRLADEVAVLKPALILSLDFPDVPSVDEESAWRDVPLERLRSWDRAPSNPRWMKDEGLTFALTTHGLPELSDLPKRIEKARARGLSEADLLAGFTSVPARMLGLQDRLGEIGPGKIANLVVVDGTLFDPKARVVETWVDGVPYPVRAKKEKGKGTPGGGGGGVEGDAAGSGAGAAGAATGSDVPVAAGSARAAAEPPDSDVRPLPPRFAAPLAAPRAVFVAGATVWTEGPAGILPKANLLAVDGKIVAVGPEVAVPPTLAASVLEVRGEGKHLTPGIVDAHSHTAIDGAVNEGTHNVTAEVRIADVLDPFDVAIYRELAGGTTVANVLHGSSNAIGGQNQIVKLRWGAGPDGLKLEGAPPGIKFALGENPKQANWGVTTRRYPQTRMGVSALVRERFQSARDYERRKAEAAAARARGESPVPVRRDLQLEAIAEVLAGTRKIHAHSYVKQEILDLLRLCESFGVKVATLQHALEAYKVADEIAADGAGASLFADWWAYKFEVWDAIPWAGPILRDRGVLVSYNSDSDELARRLNLEAAKAVKYGGVPPADALAFVTANPARQLGLAARLGTLEPGKDADFVLWSADPLSTSAVPEQTWVDGKKEFDREADLAARPLLAAEKEDLIAKARAAAKAGERTKPGAERSRTRVEACLDVDAEARP